MSHIIAFDTETTGLPVMPGFGRYHLPSSTRYYDGSRIIDIAYIVYSADGRVLKKQEFLIKPDGFEIKNSHIHGITQEYAQKNGMSIDLAINYFYEDLKSASTIVAHNLLFDFNILLSECHRIRHAGMIELLPTLLRRCTMEMGKRKLNLLKNPKLVELHKILFDEDWIQPHRALADTEICGKCYFRLESMRKYTPI